MLNRLPFSSNSSGDGSVGGGSSNQEYLFDDDPGDLDDDNELLQQLLNSRNRRKANENVQSTYQPPSMESSTLPPVQEESSQSSAKAFLANHFELLSGNYASEQEQGSPHSLNRKSSHKNSQEGKIQSPLMHAMKNENIYNRRQQHESDFSPNYRNDGNNYYDSPRNIFVSEALRDPNPSERESRNKAQDLNVLIRIFGEPYSNKLYFWIQILPSVMILGLLIGAGSLLFLFLYKSVFFYWAYNENTFSNDMNDTEEMSQTDDQESSQEKAVLLLKGHWWWLWITTVGQVLAGVILLFPKAPKLGEAKTFFHDAVTLKVCMFLI